MVRKFFFGHGTLLNVNNKLPLKEIPNFSKLNLVQKHLLKDPEML